MNWYYVEAGQQAGPVTDEQLDALIGNGRIARDTLIWREGMANWQPYHEAKPSFSAAGLRVGAPPVLEPPPSSAPPANGVVCVECGNIFPKNQAIPYGTAWVCAGCKPIFVQKLREGATLPVVAGTMTYAGFWIRFLAKFVDGLILLVVLGVPMGLLVFKSMRQGNNAGQADVFAQLGLQAILQLAYYVVAVGFNVFFVGKFGATPGKMACGLKIVTADGDKVSYARAFGRAMAEILSGLICNIGYIMAAFDEEKRSLHDRIASTRVIKTR